MKKLIYVAVAFLMAFSLASKAIAEDTLHGILKRGVLRVGTEAGYVPFEMRDKKGDIIGFDMDLAAEMAKRMEVKLKIINTAWDGIIPALIKNDFDLIAGGMTVKQSRNLKVNFADPYFLAGQTVLIRKALKGKITSYKQLNHPKYKVSSKLGTTGESSVKRLMPRAQYFGYEEALEAGMEVARGKVDAFVYDLPFCSDLASDALKGKVVHLDEPFTYEPLGWAIRKGDVDFLNFLNNFLRQIKGDGTYDKMYNYWFKSTEWKKRIRKD